MGFHNPFIKDGLIRFPDNGSLVRHVEKWAKVRGDKLAYRFLDFSTERDGVARDLHWADSGTRNRAVGARLQQVTEPAIALPSSARRTSNTSSCSSARSTPAGLPCRCSTPASRLTSGGCTPFSTTATRRPS